MSSMPLSRLRPHELPRFCQQLLERGTLDLRKAHKNRRIRRVVIRQVVRLRALCQKSFTPLDANSNHEGVWLRGLMYGLTSQQSPFDLESCAPTARDILHIWKRNADRAYKFEVDGLTRHHPVPPRSSNA